MRSSTQTDAVRHSIRWYWALGALLAFLLVLINYLTRTTALRWTEAVTDVWFAMLAVTVTWFFWICPCLMACDPHAKWKSEPAKQYASLRTTTHVPAIILSIFSGLSLIIVICDIRAGGEFFTNIWNGLSYYALLYGLTTISALAALATQRTIRRGCYQGASIRKICFECGYDLRGNPDAAACPECGAAVPWIDQEESIVGDPGQGPAGHDRA